MHSREETIFDEAVDKEDVREREKFLDMACADNRALRQRVEMLLKDYESGQFLEAGYTSPIMAPTIDLDHTEPLESMIGPYKLREIVGEGGMGIVYVAEQERPLRRKVALKIIKPGMDSREILARFKSEQQTLALMDHPNIARVLDAGETDSGRPYFVMELVRGIPITEFCDRRRLTTRQRLELFIKICQAIQHAHQKGIIHRDIKPSNVLVTLHDDVAVPKVIDFGIAKAISQRLINQTVYTRISQMVGTPLYMSPEQAEMNAFDVDTRSDVYSLGVLLYELLTGTTPFASETLFNAGYDEMRRIIREEEPQRPSNRLSTLKAEALSTVSSKRGVEPQKLGQQVRGELDWIVMKALEKDRTRRYETATGFSADVQRYLDNEPIQACPPSITYRMRKYARRYRAPLATAAALFVTMLAATAFSIRSAVVAEASRRDAVDARTVANSEAEEAKRQKGTAETLKAEAVRQRVDAQRNLYKADIRLAGTDLQNANISRLHRTLNAQIPSENEQDHRGWEWYYLQGASRQESKTLLTRSNKCVDWSRDGTKIASIGMGNLLRIWNAKDGSLIRSIDVGTIFNYGAVWSPDSQSVAWGIGENQAGVRIWNSETDTISELYRDPSPGKMVFCVAWSPDGKHLATGAQEGVLRIYDLARGNVLHNLDADYSQIWSIAWSPDGKLVAVAGNGRGGISVWNASTGEMVFEFARGQTCHAIAFSKDGDYMIAGDTKGVCSIVDVKNRQELHRFNAHHSHIYDIAVNPKSLTFATAGIDGVIHCWSLCDAKEVATYLGHEGPVYSVAWAPDGQHLVSGSTDNTIRIWPLLGNPVVRKFEKEVLPSTGNAPATTVGEPISKSHSTQFKHLQSEESELDALGAALVHVGDTPDDNAIRNYIELAEKGLAPRPTSLRVLRPIDETGFSIGIAWSNDLSKLITARRQGLNVKIESWNANDRLKRQLATQDIPNWFDVSWSPDNLRVAIASQLGFSLGWIGIYDAEKGRLIRQLTHGNDMMMAVSWNHAGTRIVSGNSNGVISLWDAAKGLEIATAAVHQSAVNSLAFSPDDRRIASASTDSQVRIIDADTVEELISINDGNSAIRRLTWSSNGKQISGLNKEGEIILWDASRGYEYVEGDDYRRERVYEKLAKAEQLVQDRRYDVALPLLEEFLSIETGDVTGIMLRGRIHALLMQHELALADYTQVLNIDRKNVLAWTNKGVAEYRLGRFDDALSSYSSAIDFDPSTTNPFPRRNRAQTYRQLERYIEALDDFRYCFDKHHSLQAGSAAAGLSGRLYGPAAYEKVCRELLDRLPESNDDVDKVHVLWCLHAKLPTDMLDRGLELAEEFYSKRDQFPEAGRWKAYSLYRLGRYPEAYELLSKSTERIPNAPTAICWYYMAMIHNGLGHDETALEWLDKANAEAERALKFETRPELANRAGFEALRNEATRLIMGKE